MKKEGILIVFFVLLFVISGCSNGDSAFRQGSLNGQVMTDNPYQEGEAKIYDLHGRLLKDGIIISTRGGFISRFDHGLPYNFELVVEIVEQSSAPFYCRMAKEVRAYTSGEIIYVNPVTTLINAYMKRHPEEDLSEVIELVKNFLEIPPENDIGYDLISKEYDFNYSQFLDEARNYASMDEFIQVLLDEIEECKTRFFGFERNIYGDIFKYILKGIGNAIIEDVTDDAIGWIMDYIGGDTGSKTEEEILNALQMQQEELKDILTKLSQLENELKQAVDEIKDAIDKSTYNTAVTVLEQEVAEIKAVYERIHFYATCKPDKKNRPDILKLGEEIKSDIPKAFIAIYDVLMGTAGAEGILSLWSRIIFKDSENLSVYSEKVYNQLVYYYGLQVKALQLIVEAYHAEDPPNKNMAKQYYNEWTKLIKNEISEYMSFNPKNKMSQQIDIDSNLTAITCNATDVFVTGDNPPIMKVIDKSEWKTKATLTINMPGTRNLGIAINQEFAYILSMTDPDKKWYLYKVSLSSPETIQDMIPLDLEGGVAFFIAANNDYVFISLLKVGPTFDTYLRIFDSNSLRVVKDLHCGSGLRPPAIFADEKYAYLVTFDWNMKDQEYKAYLCILDLGIVEIAHKEYIGETAGGGWPWIEVKKRIAYFNLLDGRIMIYNLSEIIQKVGEFNSGIPIDKAFNEENLFYCLTDTDPKPNPHYVLYTSPFSEPMTKLHSYSNSWFFMRMAMDEKYFYTADETNYHHLKVFTWENTMEVVICCVQDTQNTCFVAETEDDCIKAFGRVVQSCEECYAD